MEANNASGRLGEASVANELVAQGFEVFMPVFGGGSCDMIAVKGGEVKRVEVKSSRFALPSGKYRVTLSSRPPRPGVGARKPFDSGKSDLLAIYVVVTGRVHLLRSEDFEGRTVMTVEG